MTSLHMTSSSLPGGIVKPAVWLAMALALASCRSLDMSKINVGPGNTVSWEDAKTIIRDGDVQSVYQTHQLDVTITMADGTTYQTKEPDIDAVIHWVEECGLQGSIGIMTQ